MIRLWLSNDGKGQTGIFPFSIGGGWWLDSPSPLIGWHLMPTFKHDSTCLWGFGCIVYSNLCTNKTTWYKQNCMIHRQIVSWYMKTSWILAYKMTVFHKSRDMLNLLYYICTCDSWYIEQRISFMYNYKNKNHISLANIILQE